METKTATYTPVDLEQPLMEFERPVNPDEAPVHASTEEVVGEPVEDWIAESYVAEFEKAIKLHKRMLAAILALTNETHWVAMGKGKYYLQAPGCETLMNPLGISYERPDIRKEIKTDSTGDFYAYWVEGLMESKRLKQYGWFIGYCDSRDAFFNGRTGWTPESGEADVKKAAVSNWIGNGVTRLAGIRSPDPKMLEAAGLDLTRIAAVDYSGRAKTERSMGDKISEPQEKRLWSKTQAVKMGTAILKAHLKEHYDLDNAADIKRGDYEKICEFVDAWKP